MATEQRLLGLLADGRFHSGPGLGKALGISRAAVWHGVSKLREAGIAVDAVSGRGYRLPGPVELLEGERIAAAIAPRWRASIRAIDVHFELDSTNHYLMQAAQTGAPCGMACLAERQSAGRGRRGRAWVSPFGGNIYLSLLWRFSSGPSALSGLSLAVGVALVEALSEAGVQGLGLKWPNDVMCNGRKLAGLLLEVAGEAAGPCHAVIGVGLNLHMPQAARDSIDQPWADLDECGVALGRNQLAGLLLSALCAELGRFEAQGVVGLQERWAQHDALAGQTVSLHLPNEELRAVARGIDRDGALLLQLGEEIRAYPYGEVSVRLREGTG